MVIFGILYAFHRILDPVGLSVIVLPLAIVVSASLLMPLLAGAKRLMRVRTLTTMRWSHVLFGIGLLGALVGIAMAVPLSFRIPAPLIVEIHQPQVVYAAVAGRLTWTVGPQSTVKKGDPIAKLENDDLQYQLDTLNRQIRIEQTNLESLKRQSQTGRSIFEISLLEGKVADLNEQLSLVEAERQKCEIRATGDGTIFGWGRRAQPEDDSRTLATWSGDLLADENLGCWVEKGTPICQISGVGLQAVAYVSQQDIDRVRVGNEVDLIFDQVGPAGLLGTISEISGEQATEVPFALAKDRILRVQPDAFGRIKPIEPVFRVTIQMKHWPNVVPGTVGKVKIHTQPETWVTRFRRFVRRTFRFEW